jgi:hypothetical protein
MPLLQGHLILLVRRYIHVCTYECTAHRFSFQKCTLALTVPISYRRLQQGKLHFYVTRLCIEHIIGVGV